MRVFVCLCLFLGISHAQELKMITSVESDFSEIRETTLRNLYLGRTRFVDDQLVEIVENKNVLNMFLETYVRKEKKSYTGIWRMMVFTGKALAPKIFEDRKKLLDYVANNKNVIAFIKEDVASSKIKVLKVIK